MLAGLARRPAATSGPAGLPGSIASLASWSSRSPAVLAGPKDCEGEIAALVSRRAPELLEFKAATVDRFRKGDIPDPCRFSERHAGVAIRRGHMR
jgi:hypothetical protein